MTEFLIKMSSGTLVDLGNPTHDMIKYEDIASSLCHVNRYTGHAGVYSVAQHSIFVASLLPLELQAYGLAHDFHEAYVGDISSPVKRLFRSICNKDWGYERTVETFDRIIHEKFNLRWPLDKTEKENVVWADLTALSTEMVQLFPPNDRDQEFMSGLPAPVDYIIPRLQPDIARRSMDTEFRRLILQN